MAHSALPHRLAPLYFFVITIFCQTAAFLLVAMAHRSTSTSTILIVVSPLFIYSMVRLFALPSSWQIVNLLVGPASLFYLWFGLPAYLLIVPIVILSLIYVPTFWTRVPFYPTSLLMYDAVLAELPRDKPFKFIDLGCGFGTMLFYLNNKCPNGSFTGVEISPLPYFVAKIRSFFTKGKVSIWPKSFWGLSLHDYDYIYAFLAPGPMPSLWQKVKKEMRGSGTFLVNSFEVPASPKKIVEVEDERLCRLFVYKL